jgi:hypothetical protein
MTSGNEEETDATNELINDGEFVQPLTLGEIEGLKKSGVHASVRTGPCFMQNESIICFAGHHKGSDRTTRQLFHEN